MLIFFSLLFRELEKTDREELDERQKERFKKRVVDRTWANWLSRFLFMLGSLPEHNQQRPMALFNMGISFTRPTLSLLGWPGCSTMRNFGNVPF